MDAPGPLARGFVTYGTDSGHQNAQGVPLQAFALDDEALADAIHALAVEERNISEARRAVITILDTLQDELKRRYKDDPSLALH